CSHGDCVNNRTTAGFYHLRNSKTAAKQHTFRIDVHQAIPFINVNMNDIQILLQISQPDIIKENGDLSILFYGKLDRFVDRLLLTSVYKSLCSFSSIGVNVFG